MSTQQQKKTPGAVRSHTEGQHSRAWEKQARSIGDRHMSDGVQRADDLFTVAPFGIARCEKGQAVFAGLRRATSFNADKMLSSVFRFGEFSCF